MQVFSPHAPASSPTSKYSKIWQLHWHVADTRSLQIFVLMEVSCDTLLHSHGLDRAKEHATRVRNGENSKSHGIRY